MRQARSRISRSGQSIIEAMIAITLLLVGFLGTITLINRSVGLTRVVADNYVGSYLAAEGIEVVKGLVDANYLAERPFHSGFAERNCERTCDWEVEHDTTWASLPTEYAGRTFWFDPVQRLYSYAPFGNPTTFTRKVSVTLSGPTGKELVVESRVEWVARGGGRSAVTVEDRFYDWYNAGYTGSATTPSSSTSTAE